MTKLHAGDTGYVIANIKTSSEIKIGDTLTGTHQPATEALPGSRLVQPMVFAASIPITPPTSSTSGGDGKLQLNGTHRSSTRRKVPSRSASVSAAVSSVCCTWRSSWKPSARVRHGHHHHVSSVIYEVEKRMAKSCSWTIRSSSDASVIQEIREPIVHCYIMVPNEYILAFDAAHHGQARLLDHTESLDTKRVMMTCTLPLNESW